VKLHKEILEALQKFNRKYTTEKSVIHVLIYLGTRLTSLYALAYLVPRYLVGHYATVCYHSNCNIQY